MHRRIAAAAAGAALVLLAASGPAAAGAVCPDSSYVTTIFGCTFSGSYKPGQPYDVATIWPPRSDGVPFGPNETLSDAGIEVRVLVRDCQGNPLATNVQLRNDSLCIFSGGTFTTDGTGRGSFSGGILGKGFCTRLFVFADEVQIGSAPIRINGPGPDTGNRPQCCPTAANLQYYLQHSGESGVSSSYSIDSDFNEDGFVDLVDWVIFVGHASTLCIVSSGGEVRP